MLNKRWSGHLCLVPNLKGKAFSFYPLSMMLAVGFSYMAFICWSMLPLIPLYWVFFIINAYCTLSNAFSASIDMIVWFFFLLFMWYITFIDLRILYHPCIPGMKHSWSWCMILLIYSWVWCANILLSISASMFISDFGL